MRSVLMSFRLSMFAVAQALTSLRHDCIELSSSVILSGGHLDIRTDICNCMSSANEWCVVDCEPIMAEKVLECME